MTSANYPNISLHRKSLRRDERFISLLTGRLGRRGFRSGIFWRLISFFFFIHLAVWRFADERRRISLSFNVSRFFFFYDSTGRKGSWPIWAARFSKKGRGRCFAFFFFLILLCRLFGSWVGHLLNCLLFYPFFGSWVFYSKLFQLLFSLLCPFLGFRGFQSSKSWSLLLPLLFF